MMLLAALAGGLIGYGLLLLARARTPGRSSLARLVASATPTPVRLTVAANTDKTAVDRAAALVGAAASRVVGATGFEHPATVRRDLATLDRSPHAHVGMKLLSAAAGLVAWVAVAGGLRTAGQHVGVGMMLALVVGAAAGGFFLPDLTLRREAKQRRAEFCDTHSLFLLLAAAVIAGGNDVGTALRLTTNAGDN